MLPVLIVLSGFYFTQYSILIPRDAPVRSKCPDTLALLAKYKDGDFKELGREVEAFLDLVDMWHGFDSVPCIAQALRYSGIVAIAENQDTVLGFLRFQNALSLDSNREIFDLNVPLSIQRIWDHAREIYGAEYSDPEATWQARWMPPVDFEPTKNHKVSNLRLLYHDNRIYYSTATDAEYCVRVLNRTQSEIDPAFRLMRTEAMLRLGYGPSAIQMEMQKGSIGKSQILDKKYLDLWRYRLSCLFKNRYPSFKSNQREPKKPSVAPAIQNPLPHE